MTLRSSAVLGVLATGLVVITAACGVLYTSPAVKTGSTFGTADTDLDVNVIAMTFESTTAANLTPYIPARLPLGVQPGAVARAIVTPFSVPDLDSPPAPASRPGARPGFIPDRLPPLLAPQPYTIGVADVLLLSVNNAATTLDQLPNLLTAQSKRQGFVVQDDGAIAIPDVGRVNVAGQTLRDAEAAIFQALVSAGVDPSFSLEIAEFKSQRVSVGGKVGAPSLVPITLKPLYLNEALNAAGGVAVDDPKVAKIQLFRDGETYQMSVDRFLSEPALSQIVLQDGDSVFVVTEFDETRARALFNERLAIRQELRTDAEFRARMENVAILNETARRNYEVRQLELERENFQTRLQLGAVKRDYAYLTGEVRKTTRVELPFENKAVLADVLFKDGGMAIQTADYDEIYVLRRSSDPEEANGITAYHLNAGNATNLALASMFEMHAGDVVFIAEQPITSWNRIISQALPNLFISAASLATRI